MFDPSIPEIERVKFAVAETWRLKMARDWAPKTPMGSLHTVFSKDPALATNFENYDAFYATCKLLIDGGLDASPGLHPIIKATFSFLSGLDALSKDQPAEWRPVIAQSVVACRCGMDAWEWSGGDAHDGQQIPVECSDKVLKLIDKYFGRVERRPSWYSALQDRVVEEIVLATVTDVEKKVVEEAEALVPVPTEPTAEAEQAAEQPQAPAAESGGAGKGKAEATAAGGAPGWMKVPSKPLSHH